MLASALRNNTVVLGTRQWQLYHMRFVEVEGMVYCVHTVGVVGVAVPAGHISVCGQSLNEPKADCL
jgi:hypothetical protein